MEGLSYLFAHDGALLFTLNGEEVSAHFFTSIEQGRVLVESATWEDSKVHSDALSHLQESKLPPMSERSAVTVVGSAAIRLREMVATIAEFDLALIDQARASLDGFFLLRLATDYVDPSCIICIHNEAEHGVHVVYSQQQAHKLVMNQNELKPDLKERVLAGIANSPLPPCSDRPIATITGDVAAAIIASQALTSARDRAAKRQANIDQNQN